MHRNQYPEITHEGTVQAAAKDSVTILLSLKTGCSGCQERKACNLSDKDNKIVTIHGHYNVSPGDSVTVAMKQSMGYFALFLGYLLPLLLFIGILVFLVSLSVSELLAGLLSIAVLLPYYLILILFRKGINNKFSFTLKS
jgi:sigma-E factor negative regulatory protein RseC